MYLHGLEFVKVPVVEVGVGSRAHEDDSSHAQSSGGRDPPGQNHCSITYRWCMQHPKHVGLLCCSAYRALNFAQICDFVPAAKLSPKECKSKHQA